MRVFTRHERPDLGAKLSLIEAGADGVPHQLPERTSGWRGQLTYIDAVHYAQARIEDRVRTGKDTGIGHFLSHSPAFNQAFAALIAASLAWLRLLAQDGPRCQTKPKPCATASCTPPPA